MSNLRILYSMDDPFSNKNLFTILGNRFGEKGKKLIQELKDLPCEYKDCVKVGSSGLEVFLTRLGNFQQGNGPNNEVAWPACWIGVDTVTNLLEDSVKWELKQERGASRLGEWYDGYTSRTVEPIIEDLIEGNGFKIKKLDPLFLPIKYSNMVEFRKKMLEYYKKPSILRDFLTG